MQAYYDYQVDLAVLMGAERDTATVEMLAVLNFETDLAEVSFH